MIKIEPLEADKFYRVFKSDHGHNLFLSYVSAFANKVRAQGNPDIGFSER